ncbi:galactan export ABC transporter permease subunit Wzm/RfbD [Corynebacterium casei]|uniref:galactan export ABC transporter permease subunit Wzm/RfbD n=1 Tax=Corynebacterium casei TaxID=160386 RepID=UPI002648FC85|nr:ABC transporter permease [Corynebacterium casei]MDN5705857.1 ABC transporter permease [Corynebacterium casei]MDN5728769.1 ABC transporter permease [Corynebacterium casei]MDN5741105.1 ABC transporter permease [Corynebacterium casei]MDN5784279.1 ABC transporter permease [Corynebacterium casei]MDN5800627.1 ABC transporter permease [Corynebacterium casei]
MEQDKNSLAADIARMTSTPEGETVPPSHSMTFGAAFKDLVQGAKQRELWLMLGLQDIKQRYRRSVLGPFWITIATGVMALALGLLYSMLFQLPLADFLPHVTVGLIMWNFISGAIKEGSTIFIDNEGLIKQLPAPLSVHVYRLVWRQTLFLGHNLIIWLLLILIFPRTLGWEFFLVIPGMLLLIVNGVWVAMFFGIVATRFRDVAPLLEALTQLLFYVTPIVWTTKTLTDQGGAVADRARIAEINPLYHYLEIVRAPMIGEPVAAYHWWIVLGCTVVGLFLAMMAMRQWRFRVSYWV